MADFRNIQAWQKADDLAVLVYELTKSFPQDERFGLPNQMRRAAVSVPANIAEGSGKQTLKNFRNFLYIARGSLSEVEYYIHLAERLNYLNGQQTAKLGDLRRKTGAILHGLIKWASKQITSGRVDM